MLKDWGCAVLAGEVFLAMILPDHAQSLGYELVQILQELFS